MITINAALLAVALEVPLGRLWPVYREAERMGADPRLVCAVVKWESDFKWIEKRYPDGTSDWGYFMLNSIWHEQFRHNLRLHVISGIGHLLWCLKVERGSVRRALSRYNTGRGDSETGRAYADRVLAIKGGRL